MHHLFLDTATQSPIIGLAINNKPLEVNYLPVGWQNSKFLVPAFLKLLDNNRISTKDLGLISCGVGPGSYTGIRVSAALAQGLAYALKIPLIGFSSLEGFIPQKPGNYAAIIDAKYAGVYLQKGKYDGHTAHMSEPEVVALADLADVLRATQILVTPEGDKLREKLRDFLEEKTWEESVPSGEVIAERCYERFLKGEFDSNAQLNLLYLRKTQAEREAEGQP